jgi:hypothetical protein
LLIHVFAKLIFYDKLFGHLHSVAHHLAHLTLHLPHLLLLLHHVLHLAGLRSMLVQSLDHLLNHFVVLALVVRLLHGVFWVIFVRNDLRSVA